MRWLSGLVIVLLLSACTHVDADSAKKDLDASRAQVEQQVLELAKTLSQILGGSPAIAKRRYGVCGSSPTEALEYTAVAHVSTRGDLVVGEVRGALVVAGWTVTGSDLARGVSPPFLFVKRGEQRARVGVGVKDGLLSVGAKGDCIRVTSEQANKLSGPID